MPTVQTLPRAGIAGAGLALLALDLARARTWRADQAAVLREILAPALRPGGPAWVLANTRLESHPVLRPLLDCSVLDRDFGDGFAPLRGLPRRWGFARPRYLYPYAPPPDTARGPVP